MEIDFRSVALFAGVVVLIAAVLSVFLSRGRWREPGFAWLSGSSFSLLFSVVILFARPALGYEATSVLIIGSIFAGLVSAYFAVLAGAGRKPPWRFFLLLGAANMAAHLVIAILSEDVRSIMISSSAVNSVMTGIFAASVYRIIRPESSRISSLIAFPFFAVSLCYGIRLFVLLFTNSEAVIGAMTVMIVTVMAFAAIFLQIGAVAFRERQARRVAADALVRAAEEQEAKNRFLLGLSHELRTPLNGVLGVTELIRAETCGPLPSSYRALVEAVHTNGVKLNEMIVDLLEIAAPVGEMDPSAFLPVRLNAVAEAVAGALEDRARVKGMSVQVASEGDVVVYGDDDKLRRLIHAIAENAVKFGETFAKITVKQEGDIACILFADDGPGLSPGMAKAALDLFNRGEGVNEPRSGAGVGLSLASRIAAAHGGTLHAEPGAASGLLVRVELPLPAAAQAPLNAA